MSAYGGGADSKPSQLRATDENLTSENWEYIMDVLRQSDDGGCWSQGCRGEYDQEAGASKCERSVIHLGGEETRLYRNGDGILLTACLVACECPQPELRSKDAPGACVESVHRRTITASQRSKYTSASQGEDSRADAGNGPRCSRTQILVS